MSVGKLTSIGSDNGLSPGRRRQAIIWTNVGILLINEVREILIEIYSFSFKKMSLKMSKWRPFCLGLNVLTRITAGLPVLYQGDMSSFVSKFAAPKWNQTFYKAFDRDSGCWDPSQ